MMREIRFRAWSEDIREMIQVARLDIKEETIHYENGIKSLNREQELDFWWKPYVLMQYTGLKDKNGVEIYEGDIVETVYNGEVFAGVVVYDLSEVDFKVTDGKEKYGRNFQYLAGNDENEVIGNIYENPELLESKKD